MYFIDFKDSLKAPDPQVTVLTDFSSFVSSFLILGVN